MSSTPAPLSDPDIGRPQPAPPPAPPTRRQSGSPLVPALVLIALGAFFLVANLVPANLSGSLLFLGLGLAFLVARFLSGQYGFAVPAGILLGFGSFVALEDNALLPGTDRGGWFFILLGLGFVAVYLIGLRPSVIWPFFPAAVLIAFGVLLQGLLDASWLAPLAPLAAYWPISLVLIGLWLLIRDRLPETVRRPLGIIGLIALIAVSVLVITAQAASAIGPAVPRVNFGLPRIGQWGPMVSQTVNLNAPIAAGETLRVTNSSGRTVVRPTTGTTIQVTATTHTRPGVATPEVRLTPSNGVVTLDLFTPDRFFSGAYADYVIELPSAAALEIGTASGDVEVSGRSGAVRVTTASGEVSLSDLSGPVTVRTASGDLRLTNLTGEVWLNTISGEVQASGLVHLREATTVSGDMVLAGLFTDAARLSSTSGDITVRFAPASAVRIEASTTSGDLRTRGLTLTDQRAERRLLSGTIGTGGPALTFSTVSGDVTLSGQ